MGLTKNQYIGERGVAKRGGGVFEGVDTLMYTMHSGCNILCLDILFISLSNIWKVH